MISSEEAFRCGLSLLRQNLHEQAAEIAARAIRHHPDDGGLWELLGVARHHAGLHDAAIEALETATLLKPLDIGARFCLAGSFAANGQRELAVFVYRILAHDKMTPIWLLPRIAARFGQMAEYTDALETCQHLLFRDSTRHEAHFGIAFYLRRLGAPMSGVIDALTRAHESAQTVGLYRVVLAALLHDQGQTDEAYDLLRHLPTGTICCPHLLKRMSLVFRAAYDPDRARECRERVRDIEDNGTEVKGIS